jgi:hypothetical protein
MDTAGIDVMRALRSPRLPPVVGIAGAVLALAIALAFVTASDLVGFRRWPAHPPRKPPQTLVLRDPALVPAPLPRRSAPATAEDSRGVPRRARPAPPRTGSATDGVPPPRAPRAASDPAPGIAQRPPAPPPALPVPPAAPAPAPAALPPAPVPRSSPVRPVGDLVSATTTEVASTLRATTGALGGRTESLSPVVATGVVEVGDLLGETVQGLGQALGGLLGSPASSGPGPSPSPG